MIRDALRSQNLPQGWALLGWLALLLGTFAFQVWLWPFVTDDAYITYRYTARFCAGLGLTFNDGAAVEGYSTPLWALFLALPCLWGGSIIVFSQITGLFFAALVFAALFVAARAMVPTVSHGLAVAVAAFSSLLLLLNPGMQVYASLGMEVPLLAALLSWACAFTMLGLQAGQGRFLYTAAMLLGFAGIARPEGILYGALWGLGILLHFQPWRHPRVLGRLLLLGGLVLLPIALWLLFRLSYYQAWLPNTALAKAVPFRFRDIQGFLSVLGPLGLMTAIAFIMLPARKLFQPELKPLTLRLLLAGLGIGCAGLIFTWYGRDDWMAFARFLQPSYPVLVFISVAMLFLQLQSVTPALGRALRAVVVGATLLCSFIAYWPWVRQETIAATMMRNTEPLAVAQSINLLFPEPRTLAAGRIGALAYYNPQHTLWDFFGLVDREQALAIYNSGRSGPDFAFDIVGNPIIAREPEVLMITRSAPRQGLKAYTAADLAVLQPRWRCLVRFKQGYWGTYDVWVRNDIRPELVSDCDEIAAPQEWLELNKKK